MPKIKKLEGYVINLESYETGTCSVVTYNNIYFDSFGVYPPKEILDFMKNNDIKVNIFQIQDVKLIFKKNDETA